jgi:hypothetical protein
MPGLEAKTRPTIYSNDPSTPDVVEFGRFDL